jgi:hypothetical protein
MVQLLAHSQHSIIHPKLGARACTVAAAAVAISMSSIVVGSRQSASHNLLSSLSQLDPFSSAIELVAIQYS